MQHPFQAAEVQWALLHSLLFPFHISDQQQATVPRLQVQHLQELQHLPEEGEGLDLQCLSASKVKAYCSATCARQLGPDLSFSLYLSVVNAGGIGHEVPVYVEVDLFLTCLVFAEANLFWEYLVTCCIFQTCLAGLMYQQAVTGHSLCRTGMSWNTWVTNGSWAQMVLRQLIVWQLIPLMGQKWKEEYLWIDHPAVTVF